MTEKKSRKKSSKRTTDLLHEKVKSTVGRGVEAFFRADENPEEESASATTAASPASPPPPDGTEISASDTEDVLASMLDREVMAAGNAHEEASTLSPEGEESPPPPEESRAEVSSAEAETFPPPPDMVESPPAEEEADVTPARLHPAGTLVETPMEVTVSPPLSTEESPYHIPEPAESEATLSREEIVLRISQEHFDRLEKEISQLYEDIPRYLSTNKKAADEALASLREARELLWGAPERLVDAEYNVNQVKTVLQRFQQYVEWGRVYGYRLLAYEVCCLVVFLGAFLAVQIWQAPIMSWLKGIVGTGSTTYIDVLIPFLTSLMWGGIGGVVGALYSLWWHVAHEQDFDKRYNMWYLIQPLMGFILGGIVFLIITTGFLALEGTVPTTESSRGVQMFPALVAVLGGFRQQFVYELLERIIRVLTPSAEE